MAPHAPNARAQGRVWPESGRTTVPARANFALMFDRRRAREERRGDGLEGGLCDENANHVWGSFLPEGC
jgi:hypothetical protein